MRTFSLLTLCVAVSVFGSACGSPSGVTGGGTGATGGGQANVGGGNSGGGGGGGNGGGGQTATGGGGGGGEGGPGTYYKDVLPITQRSCNGCHVTGGIAPFALDSYAAVKDKAALVANAVETRRMPPWKASKDCGGEFVGDRSLTDAQIALVSAWSAQGAPEGDPADAPPPIDQAAEQLPRIDFEATMATAYTPQLRDDYRCFIIDPGLTSKKTVTGYDIRPGSNKVVHHVIVYVVDKAAAEARDAQSPETPGWECFGGADVASDGALGAWAPGGAAVLYPSNTGIELAAGKVLAMQVHYNTDNGVEADQTTLRLMYGTGAERGAYLLPLVASGFSIPARTNGYTYSRDFAHPAPVLGTIKLWGFLPHMHTRGKHITMESDSECLVDVPDWDFHWQSQYFRQSPYLMSGTDKVKMTCTWDNPDNQTLTWGEGTDDEMCFAFVYASL